MLPLSIPRMKNMYLRICIKCKNPKEAPAFVGTREICRNCYVYLDKDEKEKFILNERQLERRKRLTSDLKLGKQ